MWGNQPCQAVQTSKLLCTIGRTRRRAYQAPTDTHMLAAPNANGNRCAAYFLGAP